MIITKNHSTYNEGLKITLGEYEIALTKHPTGNCQTITPAWAQNLPHINIGAITLLRQISKESPSFLKSQILMDISPYCYDQIIKYFKPVTQKIIIDQDYINGTGNYMKLILIKLKDRSTWR